MKFHLPAPRLLPATIGMLVVVLAAKTTVLIRAAIDSDEPTALISAAVASGADTPTQKPAAKPADPAKPEHAAENPPVAASPAKPETTADGLPPVTDAERAVLLELRDRRKELEAREATLTARESILAAAETRLSARVVELQDLQKKLESLDANHRQQEDAAWQGLVKVYETMKPRDAAAIFNDLGMQVLLPVIDRMKEAKAAAIMAAMTPDKAREVTMQLAQSRSRTTSSVDAGVKPAVVPEPGKGPGSGT